MQSLIHTFFSHQRVTGHGQNKKKIKKNTQMALPRRQIVEKCQKGMPFKFRRCRDAPLLKGFEL